jgi:hypothetical protein
VFLHLFSGNKYFLGFNGVTVSKKAFSLEDKNFESLYLADIFNL